MADSTNKYLTLGGLQSYDTLIKQWTEDKIEGAEPKIKKLETAESGFLSSYQLVMGEGDEEKVLGSTINIPKDFLVKSGAVVELSAEEATAAGLSAAGTYLKLVLNAKEGGDNAESVVYIDVATLFNDYDVEKDATQIQLAISDDHVISAVVKAGSITVTELGNDAVETDKIKDGNVTTGKIADSAVETAKIADDAVTEDKIADDAVTEDKIVNANVTTAKIATGAVTGGTDESGATGSIAAKTIVDGNIADATITRGKIDSAFEKNIKDIEEFLADPVEDDEIANLFK